jgi:hypothetical protein
LIEGDDRASLRFHTGSSVMVNERQRGWEGKLCNRAVKIFLEPGRSANRLPGAVGCGEWVALVRFAQHF